jgi:hypothetical protein
MRWMAALAVLALGNLAGAVLTAAQDGSSARFRVACSPERPTVLPGETIALRAWALAPDGKALGYAWEATAGHIDGRGADAEWSFAGVRRGTHLATVRVTHPGAAGVQCSIRVAVQTEITPRDPSRETGWGLLPRDDAETPGYGLYSYLLFGAPPTESARERFLKAIEAHLRLVPDISSLERHIPRPELNVAYVPIDTAALRAISAESILEHYDYARARAILRTVRPGLRDGPYIVSALRPLTPGPAATPATGPHLFQDLSAVPPHLAASWIKEFLNQAAQERYWEARTAERLALNLRTTIGVLAEALPQVRRALDGWIAWSR